jgi:hypothetical protein
LHFTNQEAYVSNYPTLFDAAAVGDTATVAAILASDPSCIDAVDGDGFTALIYAARCGYIEVVEVLVERGAKLDVVDSECGTAVCEAAASGHAHVVDVLLTAGASRVIGGGPGHWAYTSSLGKQWDVLAVTRADPDVAAVYRSGGLPVERRDNYTMTELRVKIAPSMTVAVRADEPGITIARYAEVDAALEAQSYTDLGIECARLGPEVSVFRDIPADAISHYDPSGTFSFVRATPAGADSALRTISLPEFRCGSVMVKGPLTQLGFAHYSLRLFLDQAGYRNIGTEAREIYHYYEAAESDGNVTELQIELV